MSLIDIYRVSEISSPKSDSCCMSHAQTRNGIAANIKIYLVVNIDKNSLQLIGIASIYIASKIVECLPLNTDTCVMYTDYSVTKVCTSGLHFRSEILIPILGPVDWNGVHSTDTFQMGRLLNTFTWFRKDFWSPTHWLRPPKNFNFCV